MEKGNSQKITNARLGSESMNNARGEGVLAGSVVPRFVSHAILLAF